MDASSLLLAVPFANDQNSQATSQSYANKVVGFEIRLTDLDGNLLEDVHRDDELLLNVFVKDLRNLPPNSLQLFSAYTELHVDSDLLAVIGQGRLGIDFWDFKGHVADQDFKNHRPREIGGVVTARYPKDTGHLLYSLPVRAVAEGEGSIDTKPFQGDADLFPTAVYGTDGPLPNDALLFDSLPLIVLPKPNGATIDTPAPTPSNSPPPGQPSPPIVLPATTLSPVSIAEALPSTSAIDSLTTVPQPVISQPVGHLSNLVSHVDATLAPFLQPLFAATITPLKVVETVAEGTLDQANPGPLAVGIRTRTDEPHLDTHFEYDELRSDAEGTAYSNGQGLLGQPDKPLITSTQFFRHPPLQELNSEPHFGQLRSLGRESDGKKRLHVQDDRDKNWSSYDIVDDLLKRIGSLATDDVPPTSFQWEAAYARASMRRLPLQRATPECEATRFCSDYRLEYSDIANWIVVPAEGEVAEHAAGNSPRVGLVANKPAHYSQDTDSTFQRMPLKLTFDWAFRESAAPSTNLPLHEEVTVDPQGSADVADQPTASEGQTPPSSIFKYFSYFLTAFASLSIVRQARERQQLRN